MRIALEGDEHVVVRTRPHARAVRGAVWVLMLIMFLVGAVLGLLSRVPSLGSGWVTATPYLVALTWILAGLAALAWVVLPVLRWLRTRIVITTRTLKVMRGRRTLQHVPFVTVATVNHSSGLGAGAHGPGTLDLGTPRGRVVIRHCPDVELAADTVQDLVTRVHLRLAAEQEKQHTQPGLRNTW